MPPIIGELPAGAGVRGGRGVSAAPLGAARHRGGGSVLGSAERHLRGITVGGGAAGSAAGERPRGLPPPPRHRW